MKRTDIVLLLLVVGLVAIIISSVTSTSRSVGFAEAFADPGTEYNVIGTLVTDMPVVYNPQENTNLTRFHMRDREGVVQEVWLEDSKPKGLERSESIVLTGEANGTHFQATKMLMKCPSKYNEQNHLVEADA